MALLELHNVKKLFRTPEGTDHLVVDVPEFALDSGAHVALSGRSGSGKSTFLNLIAGILQPDEGAITIDSQHFSDRSESERDRLRARYVGYIFQSFNLLQGYTALENVLLGMKFGPGVNEAHARKLLERVGLGNRFDYRPSKLSIGQQQRVALARALANHPKIVLADEPTGNLDLASAAEALALIREICAENNAALLLVTHDLAVLAQFETTLDLATLNRA